MAPPLKTSAQSIFEQLEIIRLDGYALKLIEARMEIQNFGTLSSTRKVSCDFFVADEPTEVKDDSCTIVTPKDTRTDQEDWIPS